MIAYVPNNTRIGVLQSPHVPHFARYREQVEQSGATVEITRPPSVRAIRAYKKWIVAEATIPPVVNVRAR